MEIKNLRTEYKVDPIGLKPGSPRLSWEIHDQRRNVFQTAYQIIGAEKISDLEKDNSLIWNSGKIMSDQSIHVKYAGPELRSGQRIYWKVKVWNNFEEESKWSEPVLWEMGLLNQKDWKAEWIEPGYEENTSDSTPSSYLRKDFYLKNRVTKATAYITCRGVYEFSLNGEKVSEDLFTPGWTSYKERLQYQAYDVTEQLASGDNAIGVVLGDGWYRGYLVWQGNKNLYGEKLALLCQIAIEYEDGSSELIKSDEGWKSATGPILKSDIYNGETYDARLEMPGWNVFGFDDSAWHRVLKKNYGYKNIVASEGVPVRITETIKPIDKILTPKGEVVFDLGQNIVGWVRFRLKGKTGDRIRLNHAEVLDQEGNVYLDNLRDAKAEDTYIFRGDDIEVFEPHFTFHGFRYIQVSEYAGDISLEDVEGRVIHSDMGLTGEFECSDQLINRLQKNIDWGLRGNFLDLPTDCPQRDERLGWTGDAQVFAPTACFNRDVASFYTKWMKDFIVDQREDGSVPWVVPNVVEDGGGTGWSDGFGATGWADAAVIIPWTVYQVYGDRSILEEQYESMKAWEEYMIRESGDRYIFDTVFHFGDWLSFAEYYSYYYNAPDYGYAGAHTDKDLIATAYYYYTTGLMLKIATILGKNKDAKRYAAICPKIKKAFQAEFMTQTGRLTSNTQAAYTLALFFGLIPDNLTATAAKRLVDDVNHFGHLTTGFLGTPFLCQALTDSGYPEIAYKLLFNQRYPSWLYPVTKGATTIWERWDGIKPDGSFQTVGMNSFNHYAYGAVGAWLYTDVAGLKINPEKPAYKEFFVKPYPSNELTFAKATYHSMYGKISVHWERDEDMFRLKLEIPVNTKALVAFPGIDPAVLLEGGVPVGQIPEIIMKGVDDARILLELGSGSYQFEIAK